MLTVAAVLSAGTYFTVTGGDVTSMTPDANSQVHETIPRPSPAAEESTVVSGNASGRCQPGLVLGAGGDRAEHGHQAIVAFEHAYYIARDGRQARDVVASDAAVPGAEQIQVGIDSVPAGTTYCVRIHALVGGQYLVELTETRPREPETTWKQRISTAEVNGRVVITSIAAVT
ncbi:hypothetical protein [Nocardia vulneris]|uniref:hypothetical protein n=1 Tax=Nocardia vulneris TaxID=1141657 RepID=UPI0012E02292|nr:hypothetical protein [Nocardia vulneris]